MAPAPPAIAQDAPAHPLAVGAPAPGFRLADQNGAFHTLAEFRGHPVVLYFYPRDETPGCTREACAFRDAWDRLHGTGAQVLGVSTDDVASHGRFAANHQLPFPLLADTDRRVSEQYGVGLRRGMAMRVTYLIGADGNVAQVFPQVDPAVHADQVIQALNALPGATPVPPAPSAPAAPPTAPATPPT